MKKIMTRITHTLVYFFAPEDSTAAAAQADICISVDSTSLNLGSIKALFWVACTMAGFYLIKLM